jgi:hypothetical protein
VGKELLKAAATEGLEAFKGGLEWQAAAAEAEQAALRVRDAPDGSLCNVMQHAAQRPRDAWRLIGVGACRVSRTSLPAMERTSRWTPRQRSRYACSFYLRGNHVGTLSFVDSSVLSTNPLIVAICMQPALGTDGKPVWMQRLLGLDPSRDGGASGGSSDEEGQVLHYAQKAVAACQLS